MRAGLRVFVVLSLCGATARAEVDAAGVKRLADLGRVWGLVKYFHPALLSRDVDWDGALVRAVPRVIAAATDEAHRAALDGMLAELRDPRTRLVAPDPAAANSETAPLPPAAAIADEGGVVILTVRSLGALDDWVAEKPAIAARLAAARALVVDLRSPRDATALKSWRRFAEIDETLAWRPIATPARLQRVWDGFAPQSGMFSVPGSGLLRTPPQVFTPPRPGKRRTVVIIDRADSALDPIALALLADGDAVRVSPGAPPRSGETTTIAIRPGLTLEMGDDELERPLPPAVVLRDDRELLANARRLALRPLPRARRPTAIAAAAPPPRAEDGYPDMRAPSLEYRLLALYRYWNIIEYFYAYRHLVPAWPKVLEEEIPRFVSAADGAGYADALQAMRARVPDGHSFVRGHPDLPPRDGKPAVDVRVVEGRLVIERVLDPALAVGPGDVILSVDGEPAAALHERRQRLHTRSTPAATAQAAASGLLEGRVGTTATIELEGPTGRRTAHLPRVGNEPESPEPTYKLLSPEIGYADLSRLEVHQVDAMFKAFEGTRGIVFDMRGYPRRTAWAIAPRINVKRPDGAAVFRTPRYLGAPGGAWREHTLFVQPLPPWDGAIYRGATVMLIDERAQSQAEHTALFFESATDIRFVGVPTAGTDGTITDLLLPGGAVAGFTMQDVRHADGRQLQRVGIQPHLRASPTIAGLRAGRDEVLERGLEVLRERIRAAAPR